MFSRVQVIDLSGPKCTDFTDTDINNHPHIVCQFPGGKIQLMTSVYPPGV